jgi:DNA modification methylase
MWRSAGSAVTAATFGTTLGRTAKSKLKLHPTAKPVALVADAIRDASHRSGVILDPFGGAGSTLIAAEKTGRQARLIELEPRYVDATIKRWEALSGRRAERKSVFSESAPGESSRADGPAQSMLEHGSQGDAVSVSGEEAQHD